MFQRFFYRHPHSKLIIAILIGILVSLFLPTHLRDITKLLIGWNTSIWLYLLMMAWLLLRAEHSTVVETARLEDERGIVMLTMLSIAAVASLAAIVLELSAAKQLNELKLLQYIFTFATIFGSWCFVSTMFAVHYAHMYYQMPEKSRPLAFPNENFPDYWDFLYFSFTVAVAAQTSDVSVCNKEARKIVLLQSVLSFIFNAAIVGLCINIVAGLIN